MPSVWTLRPRNQQVFYGLAGLTLTLLLLAAGFAFFVAFSWPRASKPESALLKLAKVETYATSRPEFYESARFWLIRLEDDSFLALYAQDPYRGCTVPWRDTFAFTDPTTGEYKRGWFRNPCHGQTYDIYGYCVFGPCIRGLDRYQTRVEDGLVVVDTRKLIEGPPR